MGYSNFKKERPEKALKCFNQAISLLSGEKELTKDKDKLAALASAYMGLGLTYVYLRDLDSALSQYILLEELDIPNKEMPKLLYNTIQQAKNQ